MKKLSLTSALSFLISLNTVSFAEKPLEKGSADQEKHATKENEGSVEHQSKTPDITAEEAEKKAEAMNKYFIKLLASEIKDLKDTQPKDALDASEGAVIGYIMMTDTLMRYHDLHDHGKASEKLGKESLVDDPKTVEKLHYHLKNILAILGLPTDKTSIAELFDHLSKVDDQTVETGKIMKEVSESFHIVEEIRKDLSKIESEDFHHLNTALDSSQLIKKSLEAYEGFKGENLARG